jgi:hypothetical protein
MSVYIKNTERSQTNNLMLHLKLLRKQEQAKPKTSRRREIIKIRGEINEIETNKTIQRINKTKRWFFEKINKIDKPLANLTNVRREKTQISKTRNEKGEFFPRWWLEGGSRKHASYSEILERHWRHTLQAKPPRRRKTLTPPHLQPA